MKVLMLNLRSRDKSLQEESSIHFFFLSLAGLRTDARKGQGLYILVVPTSYDRSHGLA